MSPLLHCLTEDPIQVMFTGSVARMREVEVVLRGLPFSPEFSLAMTLYQDRDFGLVDVIFPVCSKGTTLAKWVL